MDQVPAVVLWRFNMRKEAAKRGLDMKITARSESEIENYIDEIDALMIGPHLQYLEG